VSETAFCDMCGGMILGDAVRYEVRIRIVAGYDVLELSEEDLKKDTRAELQRLADSLKDADPDELERGIFEQFEYDLCARCRGKYRKNPLLGGEKTP